MNCKNCGYGLKLSRGDFEKILCTYEEGECVKITELEAQIEKMKCCGNCQKLRGRFDSKTNINILYCSDSDMKQIEVGFQMCCCKWEIKEND